jgi:N6-adenosine-specific RNA methylase IME4
MQLVKYDAACRALAAARSVDEVKGIKDKAVAIRAYARQVKNPQLEADAWEIRKRAEDRLGELSAALERAPGGPPRKSPAPKGQPLKTDALKAAGLSLRQANKYEQFHRLPAAEKERRIARGRAAIEAGRSIADSIAREGDKAERRAERERELAVKVMALPSEKCAVIACDDEFDHQPWSRETGMDRHASNHYETASDAHTAAEMHERTKDRFNCAAPDCLLAMWSTVQHLDIAIDLLRLRGFRYVSHYVWGKDKIGLGHWNRNKHEILLLGVKGDVPCPAPGKQWDSLIMAPRGEHSAKPECFLEMLEQYFPNVPKIELNRRGSPRPGWSCWGNEAQLEEAGK